MRYNLIDLTDYIMNWQKLKKQDFLLTVLIILLSLIGLLIIYSTTFNYSPDSTLGQTLPKQIIFLIFGLSIYFILLTIDISWLENQGILKLAYLLTLFLQIIVKFFGDTRAGTNRWLDIGFFSLQPAEYAKIVIILITAKALYDIKFLENKPVFNRLTFKKSKKNKFSNLFIDRPVLKILAKNAIMVLPLIALTLIQPSLGNALISLALWLLVLLVLFPKPIFLIKTIIVLFLGISLALQIWEVSFESPSFIISIFNDFNWVSIAVILVTLIVSIFFLKIKPKHFVPTIIIGLIVVLGIPTLWNSGITNYQKERVLTFFEGPESDPTGSGYQVIQSKIAIGSGMFWGRGYLQGTQSSLRVLTQASTDFAFAAYAEQFGFVGSLILLGLYFVLLLRILKIARESKNEFGKYLALGVGILMFLHIFINIGMNLGKLPVTGIPLPLISYGGSATVMILICLGLVQSVQTSRKSVDIANNLMLTSASLLNKSK